MKKILRWILISIIIFTLLAGVIVFFKWDSINRLLAVNSLFSEEKIVGNFNSMEDLFFHTYMDVPNDIPDLPANETLSQSIYASELSADIEKWVGQRNVMGIVVLKDGEVIMEDEFQDDAYIDNLRISWSVAKSFLSALVGIILEEGDIDSLDEPVTKYAPTLVGTAYDGATIRNVLNMASGVHFNENYADFNSDINRMGRVLALGGSMDEFAAGITERAREPGTQMQYVSIDTHVISMVIRGATGRTIPELMEEKLLGPLGLEADPYYVIDGYGVAFVLGGLNLRTVDYARFGQLFLQNGYANGKQIIPASWIETSTEPSAPTVSGYTQYGYQWWIEPDAPEGEYYARGIYGQYIYINHNTNVVIAINSADRAFQTPGAHRQNIEMFRAISGYLADQ